MGSLCSSCFKGAEENNELMPSVEDRRRLQEEAAEARRIENERRGIKDPEAFKRKQLKAAELAKQEKNAQLSGGNPVLKWQAS